MQGRPSHDSLKLQVVTIFEEGEPLIDGEPGDLKFIVKSATDPKFVRQKDDLWYQQTISLEEALIGFSRQVRHAIKVRLRQGEPFRFRMH